VALILKQKKYRFYYTTTKRILKTIVGIKQKKRDKDLVVTSYGNSWPHIENWIKKQSSERVFLLNGTHVVATQLDYIKCKIKHVSAHIGSPESLLELGSGNGFILLAQAALHPEIKVVRGVDLTRSGVEVAKRLRDNPPVKEIGYVTNLRPEEVASRLKGRDIDFFQGDMTALALKDNSFECVFSQQAIEQIPVSYPAAFREAYRVTQKRAVFAEEFREAQDIFQLLHLRGRDYFRASYKAVEEAGFTVACVEPIELTKVIYGIAVVVAEK